MKNTNLIIGKTNSGKTRGLLLKEVKSSIENNENLLILDDKKEYYQTYSKKLKENGYDVLVINLDEPTKSNGFNPLYLPYYYYKNGEIDTSINLINKLAHSIFYNPNSNSDPFWENMASDYFTGLTQILFKEGDSDEINLGSISMISIKGEKSLDEGTILKKYLNNFNPLDPIYVSASPTVFSPVDTKGSIISVMKEKLNLYLMRPNLLNLLNTSEIKLNELKNKTAIFIVGNNNYNNIVSIFMNQLIEVIIKNKTPFTFILDNYNYPYISTLKYLVENSTYYNLKLFVTTKNKQEFESKYEPYIIDSFENIVTLDNSNLEIETIGSDNEYPNLGQKEHKYFDFEKIVK